MQFSSIQCIQNVVQPPLRSFQTFFTVPKNTHYPLKNSDCGAHPALPSQNLWGRGLRICLLNTLSVDSGADERLRACVAWYPSGLFGLCSDTASEGLATSRGSCLIHALHLGGETCILQLLPWGPAAPSRLPFPYTLPVFEGTRACEQQRRDEKGKAGREEGEGSKQRV